MKPKRLDFATKQPTFNFWLTYWPPFGICSSLSILPKLFAEQYRTIALTD